MRTRQLVIICVAAALVSGSMIFNGYAHMKGPGVVVYLGAGAKQPATLPLPEATVVAGDRAALWWTVFCKAEETQFVHEARETASIAVRVVYGDLK